MTACLTAEISTSAVEANLQLLRSLIPEQTKLCAVVKVDCYGHGLGVLLDVISENTDWLAVATGAEAMQLRELGYSGEILMFFSASAAGDDLDKLIVAGVTLTVTSISEVELIEGAARRAEKAAEVHVKIDTGMTRSGVLYDSAPKLIKQLRKTDGKLLGLGGLYTHFACADEADKTSAQQQFELFESTVSTCGGRDELILHAANSAATIDLPCAHLDMVRPGIAVYGYQPSDQMHNRVNLRPALRLTGRLMQIKDVSAGDRCGYGLTHEFSRPGRVGLVPVGYADGYRRCLSNQAVMRLGQAEISVCGNVSMDQTIVDLTDLPDAKIGDEVEIISPEPAAPNSAENLARAAGTIPYEITCGLGKRVRRVSV